MHPQFADLLSCAVEAGLAVEVYTTLTRVRDSWWDLFACPRVSLATSYYSDDPGQHDTITGWGSHARTRANIAEAVRRGIPLRGGIISVREGQRAAQAHAELEALGVTRIGTDRLRHLGRAAGAGQPDVSELCGNFGHGIAAIFPSGDVTPCVIARWLTAGNVRETPLADILSGRPWPRLSPSSRRDQAMLAALTCAGLTTTATSASRRYNPPCAPRNREGSARPHGREEPLPWRQISPTPVLAGMTP